MACDILPWNEHTVGGYRAWHSIIAIGQHKQGQTMSGVECHIALGQLTVSNDVKHAMPLFPWGNTRVRQSLVWHGITSLGQHTRSNYVGCGMPSLPLDNTDGRTTSGVSCYHHPWLADKARRRRPWQCHSHTWTAQTIGLRQARHDMMSLGQHTWSDDVDHGNVIMSLGFHTQSNDVKRGMPSSPLESIHGGTIMGVVCYQ